MCIRDRPGTDGLAALSPVQISLQHPALRLPDEPLLSVLGGRCSNGKNKIPIARYPHPETLPKLPLPENRADLPGQGQRLYAGRYGRTKEFSKTDG